MKWCNATKTMLAAAAMLAILISGCGSSSPNVITVTVTPSSAGVISGQVQTFTATVAGSTVTTVTNWPCTFSYTVAATTATPNPPATTGTCTSGGSFSTGANGGQTGSFGTWTITTANGSNVLTYTAPTLANFPKPYVPTLTFTAKADANQNKTATAIVDLDSGIRTAISPTTVTVPVGITPAATASFSVTFSNTPPVGVQYKLVQPNTSSTNINDQTANPNSDTCTVASPTTTNPGCGSIDANGTYTAPNTLPTATVPSGGANPTSVVVVAWSSADQIHYANALITLINATTNAVSYNGLYPPSVAAGGLLQDVFLNASNLLNNTQIFFIPPTAQANLATAQQFLLSNTTQVFTIPISNAYCTPSPSGVTPVVTCDASITTRVRLLAAQLAQAEPNPTQPAWILVANIPGTTPPQPTPPCITFPNTTNSIACPIHIVKADPGLVTAVPDVTAQSATAQAALPFAADGGYFGYQGSLATMLLNGKGLLLEAGSSGPRQIVAQSPSFQLPGPGLYEVTVQSNSQQQGVAPEFTTLISNTAIQPSFATFNPNPANTPSVTCSDPSTSAPPLGPTYPNCVLLNGGGNPAPGAIVLDSVDGYGVIAEQGTGALQLIGLTSTGPVQKGSPVSITGTQPTPTGLAIDNQLSVNGGNLLAVVSSLDSTLYLYSVTSQGITPFNPAKSVSLDLRTLLSEPTASGLPTPYSIGIDPSTHLGVVAYSDTNIAFIVDPNPNLDGSDTHKCFLAGQVPPCVIAPVSVVTGDTPQVVMQPNVPLAYVTPGGGTSTTSVVNLLQQGTSVQIEPFVSGGTSGAVRTAGITKIITTTPHGINPILGGTVIISGILPTAKTNSDFNGTFQILPGSVLDPYTFSYTQIGMNDDVESNPANMLGTVQYGTSYYSLGTSTTVSGAAINPITRTFGYADYNQSASQIGFISTLDQTLNTLTLTQGSCGLTGFSSNVCSPSPAGAPELGFRSVAFDPFVDVAIAYAPSANTTPLQDGNKISLINPGGSTLGGATSPPYRIIAAIPTGQIGQGSYTPSGATAPVTVYGPMAYDPKTKYVMVVNAGSNSLSTMSLDPQNTFQPAHIQDLKLPVPSCSNVANPQTCFGVPVIQPPLSTSNPSHAPGPCSPTNPSNPCMPQAVQVGIPATIRILGQGFLSIPTPVVVRLDAQTELTPSSVTDSEIDVTIPAANLTSPHVYAVDVISSKGGSATNEIDLNVIGLLDMGSSPANGCTPTTTYPQGPEGVAIDQTLHVALVTNYACNNVSLIAVNPNGYMRTDGSTAPFGTILGSVAVGNQPIAVAVLPRLGYAVVTNSGGTTGATTSTGTASIINYSNPENPQIVTWSVTTTTNGTTTTTTQNYVTVGLSPLGVTFDNDRGLALVANNGSNTLSAIDLTCLLPTNPSSGTGHVQGAPVVTTIALSGPPTAIAVDPNEAVAAVTNLQNSGTTSVTAGIDVVNMASVPPVKSTTASVSSLAASLTGIVYDPGDQNVTNTTTTGLFYATSSQANAIYSFNATTGSTSTIRVGINPFSVGYNYQTGGLLTINSTSSTSSLVDVQSFTTRQTLGISSMSQFSIDVDNVTNIAVIPDQNNNRVIFLAMPK